MADADVPQAVPEAPTSLEAIRCSFCGKRGTEVASIVTGPTPAIAICSECVGLCAEIMPEQRA
jgi:hypothetical protein